VGVGIAKQTSFVSLQTTIQNIMKDWKCWIGSVILVGIVLVCTKPFHKQTVEVVSDPNHIGYLPIVEVPTNNFSVGYWIATVSINPEATEHILNKKSFWRTVFIPVGNRWMPGDQVMNLKIGDEIDVQKISARGTLGDLNTVYFGKGIRSGKQK
jgi:hypothetical protein